MATQKTKSQFMHLELYSRLGNKIAGKTNTDGVVKEAIRHDGFTDHIVADGFEPIQPNYLYSQNNLTLDQHYEEILVQVGNEKDSLGRKIKSDKNILMAGVVSFPKPRLADNWSDDDRQNYELFKSQSVEFVRDQWGENLLCVLEHTDEEYLHLHFYVANKSRVASTPELHPGYAENIRMENEAKQSGATLIKKDQVAAYKSAMRKFQDQFYEKVGVCCGFDRMGPKAQRMNRKEWKARKQVTKKLSDLYKKLKAQVINNTNQANQLNETMEELGQQIQLVTEQQNQLSEEHQLIESSLNDIEFAKYVKEKQPKLLVEFKMSKIGSADSSVKSRNKFKKI